MLRCNINGAMQYHETVMNGIAIRSDPEPARQKFCNSFISVVPETMP
jgi:hypothetical protein